MRRWKFAGMAVVLTLQGCAASAPIYVDAAATDGVLLHVEAPFVRSRPLYPDAWANLTVWDFSSDPKGKMLGIKKLRADSRIVDTRLAVGRKLQLVMFTRDGFMDTVAACGAYVDLVPESDHEYLLKFDFAKDRAEWGKGCHISLLQKTKANPRYVSIREFTAPTTFTHINIR